MKRILTAIAALALLVSCDEWEPVYTFDYGEAGEFVPASLQTNTTIAQLKALYNGKPVTFDENYIIGGKVVSNDISGNIYRSLYIQDETGALEIKIGKTNLTSDYKPGQMLYVECEGLTLGTYGGMLQLGLSDPTGEYETAYIDADKLIKAKIHRGALGKEVAPIVLDEAALKANLAAKPVCQGPDFGKLVTLKGLTYGGNKGSYGEPEKRIFLLLYYGLDHKSDRLFMSEDTYGVTTWAMSKDGFLRYVKTEPFQKAVAAEYPDYETANKVYMGLQSNASAYSVSHYFKMGGTEIQIRTSGYAKFADTQIDPAILDGSASVDVTGILTTYNDAIQFTLIDLNSVVVNK